MTTKIQIRRGTAASWTTANTLLLQAELGIETDTGKMKSGDGSTLWNSLPYLGVLTAAQAAAVVALVSTPGILTTKRSHGGTKRQAIAQWQTTFGNSTWRYAVAVPAHVTAVRVAFPVSASGTWTVDEWYVGSADSASTPTALGSGGAWTAGTFDGGFVTAKTIPQTTLPSGYQAGSVYDYVLSDWIPVSTFDVSGKFYKIVIVSIYSASATTATCNAIGGDNSSWQTIPPLPVWDSYNNTGGNFASNTSTLSGASNPQTVPIFGIEFMTASAGISIGSFSDSIDYGYGLTPSGTGWPVGTAALLSASTGGSVSCMNQAISGDTTKNSMNRFRRMALRGALPDICIFRPYTPNSPSDTVAARMAYAQEFVQTCFENNRMPVLACGIYESAVPGHSTPRDATTAALITFCAAWNIPLLHLDQIITSANGASLLQGDGLHPNATGTDALAAYAAQALLPYAKQLMSV